MWNHIQYHWNISKGRQHLSPRDYIAEIALYPNVGFYHTYYYYYFFSWLARYEYYQTGEVPPALSLSHTRPLLGLSGAAKALSF